MSRDSMAHRVERAERRQERREAAARRDARAGDVDWQERFAMLYADVAACEAPAGSQVDDVLEVHQGAYDEAVGR